MGFAAFFRCEPCGYILPERWRLPFAPEFAGDDSSGRAFAKFPSAKALEQAHHGAVVLLILTVVQPVVGTRLLWQRDKAHDLCGKPRWRQDHARHKEVANAVQNYALAVKFVSLAPLRTFDMDGKRNGMSPTERPYLSHVQVVQVVQQFFLFDWRKVIQLRFHPYSRRSSKAWALEISLLVP